MTPDDLDAIRARDAAWGAAALRHEGAQDAKDRRALLAEVDRLTQLQEMWETAVRQCRADERARILATIEALPIFPGSRGREVAGGYVRRAAVLAAIDEAAR